MDTFSTAKQLSKTGLVPILLNGKKPIEFGWQKLTPETETPEIIEAKFSTHDGNIGLLTYNHQVIDWDNTGEHGELHEEWLKAYPSMEKTIRVKSGRASIGYHYLVRIKNETERKSANLYYKGQHIGELLGITSNGTVKQSVFPPSIHPDTGNQYELIGNFPFNLDDIIVIEDLESVGFTVNNIDSSSKVEKQDKNEKDKSVSGKEKKVKNREKYLNKLMAKSFDKLRIAKEGERNDLLYKQSFHLATHFHDDVKEDVVMMELVGIGRGLGLDENAVLKTIKSGWEAGAKNKITIIESKDASKEDDKDNTLQVMIDALNKKYKFRRNLITNRYEYSLDGISFSVLRDYNFNTILNDLRINESVGAWSQALREIIESDFSPEFHPFKEYFNKIASWDSETDHIKELANMVTLVNPEEYTQWYLYLKRWMIATVATWLEVGVNHTCLILQGGQGIGKSMFLNRLCPISEYKYCGFIDASSKDSQIEASKKGLIVLDELEGSTKYDWSHLKTLLTQKIITIREPYGRYSEDLIRHAAFCGSINKLTFLDDDQYRRWLVVEVEGAKFDFPEEIIEKAYSQAYSLLKNGEKYWFDGDDIEILNQHNQKYQINTIEEDRLFQYFKTPCPDDLIVKELTTTQIRGYILDKSGEKEININRLGRLLTKNKFPRKQKRGVGYVWTVALVSENLYKENPNQPCDLVAVNREN